jgi:hypothetical protein
VSPRSITPAKELVGLLPLAIGCSYRLRRLGSSGAGKPCLAQVRASSATAGFSSLLERLPHLRGWLSAYAITIKLLYAVGHMTSPLMRLHNRLSFPALLL